MKKHVYTSVQNAILIVYSGEGYVRRTGISVQR